MINEFKKFPKVELHVHLDCCLSFDALKKSVPKLVYQPTKKNLLVLVQIVSKITLSVQI